MNQWWLLLGLAVSTFSKLYGIAGFPPQELTPPCQHEVSADGVSPHALFEWTSKPTYMLNGVTEFMSSHWIPEWLIDAYGHMNTVYYLPLFLKNLRHAAQFQDQKYEVPPRLLYGERGRRLTIDFKQPVFKNQQIEIISESHPDEDPSERFINAEMRILGQSRETSPLATFREQSNDPPEGLLVNSDPARIPKSLVTQHHPTFPDIGERGLVYLEAIPRYIMNHWFEILPRELGLGIKALDQLPVALVLGSLDIQIMNPLQGTHPFEIRTRTAHFGNTSLLVTGSIVTFKKGQEIVNMNLNIRLVCFGKKSQQPEPWPKDLKNRFFVPVEQRAAG